MRPCVAVDQGGLAVEGGRCAEGGGECEVPYREADGGAVRFGDEEGEVFGLQAVSPVFLPFCGCGLEAAACEGAGFVSADGDFDLASGGAHACTASSSLPPWAEASNMLLNSHFSRTKMLPRLTPWW